MSILLSFFSMTASRKRETATAVWLRMSPRDSLWSPLKQTVISDFWLYKNKFDWLNLTKQQHVINMIKTCYIYIYIYIYICNCAFISPFLSVSTTPFSVSLTDKNKAEQRNHCSTTRVTLSQSASKHTEQETLECNKSSLTLQTKQHLRVRVLIHAEDRENYEGEEISDEAPRKRRHACKQCSKKFFLLHTLRKHLLTHSREKSYSCKLCKKQLGSKGALKTHQLIHTGDKLFKCEQCGKTCARRGDLKIHMLSHSEERPYSCSYCTKSFKQLAKLKQHERVHTGEKPYQCKFCSKRFRLQTSLAEHQYTHSGEKPFKCTLCPKTFSSRNNLKKHQMIHTGEKPYCCGLCSRDFSRKESLERHLKVHTKERPHHCGLCRRTFTRREYLVHHLKTDHTERPGPPVGNEPISMKLWSPLPQERVQLAEKKTFKKSKVQSDVQQRIHFVQEQIWGNSSFSVFSNWCGPSEKRPIMTMGLNTRHSIFQPVTKPSFLQKSDFMIWRPRAAHTLSSVESSQTRTKHCINP